MFRKIRSYIREFKLTMKMKLVLSLSSIAVILLVSSFISIMEYSRMSSYVSNLIAGNIGSINAAQKLADAANAYNLGILAVIGDNSTEHIPELRQNDFIAHCDSLKSSLTLASMLPLADSVLYSYSAYMLTTLELPQAILSDFINTREWYFDRLQPQYDRLRTDIDALVSSLYKDLHHHTKDFDSGFYRSIIPSSVSVAVALLLVLMLLYFINSYYISPVLLMHKGLKSYNSFNKKYTVEFEGDDELKEINEDIAELCDENQKLKNRISALKKKN